MCAVDEVSLSVAPGEILAVVGANGAGKTTLMNVACGLYRPDAGETWIGGERVVLKGPRDAIARGIGMVHQHFMLVPPLSVAENVVLGHEPRRWGLFDASRARDEVRRVGREHGLALDPDARVEETTVGMQQRAEIVKALYRKASVLILDEPTAMLTPQESTELLEVIRGLAAAGKAVVLVSHRLKEVLAVAHRVAVMRGGKLVATTRPADTTAGELADLMVGQVHSPTRGWPATSVGAVALATEGLVVKDDRGKTALDRVSLELRGGEILAVAGVDGNGQAELAEALTGLRRVVAGRVLLSGHDVTGLGPRALRARGMSHVPEDRQRRGLLPALSVAENLALGRHRRPPFARGAFVDLSGRADAARRLVAKFDVRPPNPDLPARALSGGNQQKVILAREMDAEPKVLVAVQPTRGLDVGATAMVHDQLRRARAEGRAVLLVSLDLDEIMALADRIAVLFRGRVAGVVLRTLADETMLGRLMLGQGEAEATA